MSVSEFRKKIHETTTPAVHNRRAFTTVARVTASDEINNLCSIEFVDKDGYKSNKNNIPVKVFAPGFIGWFPDVNEYVNIEETNGVFIITSKNEQGYGSAIRSKNKTKKDIYTTSFGGTMAGSIF
jgi:hypothetical protein